MDTTEKQDWFARLDAWGAPGRPYREIADWLRMQGLTSWWAQKIVVEYEQARGIREPGVRPDGTFTVSASKTVHVPYATAYDAVAAYDWGEAWEPRDRPLRYDVPDGSRVAFDLAELGPDKVQVVVSQERIPGATTAAAAKVAWRRRLEELRVALEG